MEQFKSGLVKSEQVKSGQIKLGQVQIFFGTIFWTQQFFVLKIFLDPKCTREWSLTLALAQLVIFVVLESEFRVKLDKVMESVCGVLESEFGVVVLNNNVNLHSIVQNYYKIIDVSIDQESQNSRLIHTQELLKDAEVVTKVKNVDAEAASIEWLFLVSWMLVLLQNGYIWEMYYLKHYRCQNGGWSKKQKV